MSARLSISSWSLHRTLGSVFHKHDGCEAEVGDVTLLELPSKIAQKGIKTLEICHFHFPRIDDDYIVQLRTALDQAEVELYSILIDDWDITHPNDDQRSQEIEKIKNWIDIAGKCGASCVRVIAGMTDIGTNDPSQHPAIQYSAQNLDQLSIYANQRKVQVITENFHQLAKRADTVLAILEQCQEKIGLCVDFGNFRGDGKYAELAAILPYATSVHAKANYPEVGQMERIDFDNCLELAKEAKFSGPYSLIFDSSGSEWESLAEIQSVVENYI